MSRNSFGAIERSQLRADAQQDQARTERVAAFSAREHAECAAADARLVSALSRHITDEQRVKWMAARIDYIEHRNHNGIKCVQAKTGQYWPQCEDEAPADPNMIGLSLIAYIDAQIMMELKS